MPDLNDPELHQAYLQHVPLVEKLARSLGRKLPASVEADDLVQDGHVALLNGILAAFRQLTAEHFRNYIALRVQGAMLDGLRAFDPASRQLRRDMRAVEQAIQQLGHGLGRAPREQEVAAALGLPLRKYQRLLQEAGDYSLVSLDDLEPLDLLAAPLEDNPLAMLERAALRQSLAQALQGLPAACTKVLRWYYVEGLKMQQIALKLRVSEARVSQIHAQAIAQLRARMLDGAGQMPVLKPRRSARPAEARRP